MQSREKLIIVYLAQGPGHVMYPGVHSVRYVASDAAGNRAECHFSIHVRGKFMPLCPAGTPTGGLRGRTRRETPNGVATRHDAAVFPSTVELRRRVAFFSL